MIPPAGYFWNLAQQKQSLYPGAGYQDPVSIVKANRLGQLIEGDMASSWVVGLKQLVEDRPIVVLRFKADEWEGLHESRRGVNEFTIARPHAYVEGIRIPTPCLTWGEEGGHLYFGIISSRNAVTTLDSRIKIRRNMQVRPASEAELLQLINEKPYARILRKKLERHESVIALSSKLSSHMVDKLASIESNRGAMRAVAESLSAPKRFHGAVGQQEDAVRMALSAFGLTSDDQAISLELVPDKETALSRVNVAEDSVIEHDARYISGYDLVRSDLTGHAVFRRGNEQLEVFTANRRDLEHVFGVDLIYLNASRKNIVMVQYKMLEPLGKVSEDADWLYRPNRSFSNEIRRMGKFSAGHKSGPYEYRLNPTVFYLKFVKRDSLVKSGGIIISVEHYEKLSLDPACRGPRGGLRISYRNLAGCYLRQGAFLDLIRSGYIGAHAETAADLRVLIEDVLKGNKSVVAAIQRPMENSAEAEEEDVRDSGF